MSLHFASVHVQPAALKSATPTHGRQECPPTTATQPALATKNDCKKNATMGWTLSDSERESKRAEILSQLSGTFASPLTPGSKHG